MESFLSAGKDKIKIKSNPLIECISVYNRDGSLVFKDINANKTVSINNLNQDMYIVVLNFKNGKFYSSVIDVGK